MKQNNYEINNVQKDFDIFYKHAKESVTEFREKFGHGCRDFMIGYVTADDNLIFTGKQLRMLFDLSKDEI